MTVPANEEQPHGPTWWAGLAAGGLVMAYGAYGLLANLLPEERPRWLLWFAGGLIVHDLLLAPAVLGVSVALRRLAPGRWLAALQAGLVVSGLLTLASVPVLTGYGRESQPGNTSVLPLDYPRNLLMVLLVVWAVIGVLSAAAVLRRRAGRTSGPRRTTAR